ncbi:Uncharacterized protein MCHI_001529, partial [Candidatus Magnetoovum chiemensis]
MKTARVKFTKGVLQFLEEIEIPEGMEFNISIPEIEQAKDEKREKAKKEFFDWIRQIHEQNNDIDPNIIENEIAE